MSVIHRSVIAVQSAVIDSDMRPRVAPTSLQAAGTGAPRSLDVSQETSLQRLRPPRARVCVWSQAGWSDQVLLCIDCQNPFIVVDS